MSSHANGGATKSSRFELPALDLNFGNITDGTNIPPPPDSPVQREPTPPQTPTKVTEEPKSVPVPVNGTNETPQSNGKLTGTKRPADEVPLSPPVSTRQGSLRRLFSRSTLNNSYLEGQTATTTAANSAPRPQSRGAVSMLDDRKSSKRSSSWFKRFRSGDSSSRRASVMISDIQPPATPQTPTGPKTPAGPPPPMIPELKEFEKEDRGLGDDLFKNIK
ncbi:hypothetical protein HJFPF1_04919 [Paramyrothecium foliicola]|nr:hypothetical protein HJFPF1_04919 [Paramyrothecium foliicola]